MCEVWAVVDAGIKWLAMHIILYNIRMHSWIYRLAWQIGKMNGETLEQLWCC